MEAIGLPSSLTIANAISFLGTLIPTSFFFLNALGRLLFPFKINVYGPGRDLFNILNVGVLIWFT